MPASKIGVDEPDLPFIDLYDSNAPVAPTNTTRIRRSGNLLQVSTDAGAYVTWATGTPGTNNRLNIDEPPLPWLDITDGAEGPGPVNRTRIVRLTGNLSATVDGGAPTVLLAGSPGANNVLQQFRPMELVDVWDSGAPVSPANTMRIRRNAGSLQLSTDSGAYTALLSLTPPGSPFLWFDAQNVDGLGNNNAGLSDGQQVGTWVNLGSGGVGWNRVQATAGLRPLFRKVAVSGKLNNLSGLETDGTKQMSSTLQTAQVQPLTFYTVVRCTGVGSQVFIAGSAVGNIQLYVTGGTTINLFAGANVTTGQSISANTFHQLGAVANGGSSSGSKDGVASGTVAAGADTYDTSIVMADRTPASFMTGFVVEDLMYVGAAPTLAQVTTYFTTKYGALPQ